MKKKLMKIYLSEDARYNGKLLYHAIVIKLKELKIAGVTVIRGIEGYGPENFIRTTNLVDLSASLPIIVEIVDDEDKLLQVAPILKEMVTKGMIILSDVDIL